MRLQFLPLLVFSVVITASITPPTIAQDSQAIIDSVNAIIQDSLNAQLTPAPPAGISVEDKPNDGGGAVIINWDLSPDDDGSGKVAGYKVFRGNSADGEFVEISENVKGSTEYTDNKAITGKPYFYQVKSFIKLLQNGESTTMTSSAVQSDAIKSSAQWFNTYRFWCLIFVLIISGAIIFFIQQAKKGTDLYVRKIAGINAVEEAVGRATEMGRKIFYIPGIQDMNDVQTIAGIAILGRVGQLAAQYETWLEVPVSKSLVMVTARETLKESYTQVGRPDSFQENQVHYLTDDQFGYAAAIDGMVVREKPATIFYMGAFFAESLILAETGNAAGAIQIAGTAMPSQLPFFVASCDYTLIGEELFAASAYLSKEPRQLGSLKGQDIGKAIFLLAIIIGVLLETFFGINASQIFTVR